MDGVKALAYRAAEDGSKVGAGVEEDAELEGEGDECKEEGRRLSFAADRGGEDGEDEGARRVLCSQTSDQMPLHAFTLLRLKSRTDYLS